jgi:hypothetical protein
MYPYAVKAACVNTDLTDTMVFGAFRKPGGVLADHAERF